MRYLCVHCDHRWEAEGAETPKRCPSCMRGTGVEPVREQAPDKPASRSRALAFGGLALVLVAVAVAIVALRNSDTAAPKPGAVVPLELDDLKAELTRQQVDAGGLEKLLEPNAAIEKFAEQATKDASDPVARGGAVTKAIRARASATAFVPWSLGEPRTTPIGVAADTLGVLNKDAGRAELYPIEVASLAVAALRSLDVPAMLAEVIDVPGERAPLDPSGYMGYFGVAILAGEGGDGKLHLFDPYGGRTLSAETKHKVLSDPTAVGAALALRAIHEMAYKADPKQALESSSSALNLAGSLPSVRTARGVIVLSNKMVEQGLQEFAAANQLRSDAPRLHNLASATLMTGDEERATSALTRALEKSPDFASAQATLAALNLLRGDVDGARASFDNAERIAPDLSLVQWGLAEFALRTGDREQALARARRALERRPSFDAKVRYGVLLRQAAQYDEMRKVAHELMDGAPAYRKGELRELLTALLGPTALDPIEPDPSADDLKDLGGPDLNLQLGSESKLLAEPPKAGTPAAPPAPGEPALMLGDPSKLHLGGPDTKLKLKLSEP